MSRIELGLSQSSEIVPHAGETFVGCLPAPHVLTTPYLAAAIGTSSQGAALLDGPGRAAFEAFGFARRYG